MTNTAARTTDPAVMTAIDLFCGAGGLSLGAARAGLTIAAGVELDEQALATHRRNFPEARHLEHDVAGLTGAKLLELSGVVPGSLTALIGGPPCQGFSVMGERKPDDVRNTLFGHFMRLVGETLPFFFVAENVPGISHPKNELILKSALAKIPKRYQLLPPVVVQGEKYGAPTSRKRIFFIGVDTVRLPPMSQTAFDPRPDTPIVQVKDALLGLPCVVRAPEYDEKPDLMFRTVKELPKGDFFDRVTGHIPLGVGHAPSINRYQKYRKVNGHFGVVHAPEIAERYGALAPGKKDPVSKSVRLKEEGFCPTLRAGTGSEKGRRQAVRPIHPTEARVITPREAARLQGFPDWFALPDTKWHSFRQIGNSVSPIVAEAILSRIVAHILASTSDIKEVA